jgi:hypothetical protein
MKKKNEVSAVVSEAGVYLSLMTELDRRVRSRGGTFVDWHRLVKPDGESTLDEIADLIVRNNLGDMYPVSIQASLKDLITAGHYDWVNDNITAEHFPLDSSQFGEFKLVLVPLDRSATTSEVLAYLKEKNLEPAKIEHLLGFGAKYPDVQREFPIVALGSSWVSTDGYRKVPSLGSVGGDRLLNLYWYGFHWLVRCRFLALSK